MPLMLAALFIACWMIPSLAHAEWYVAGYGGINVPWSAGLKQTQGSVTTNYGIMSFTPGALVGAKIGTFFQGGGVFEKEWIGVEGEVLYAHPAIKQQTLSGSRSDSSTTPATVTTVSTQVRRTDLGMLAGFANVIFRYPGERFQPYIGAGLGYVSFMADDAGIGKISDGALAGNLSAGLKLKLSQRIWAFTEYKHILAGFETQNGTITSNFQSSNFLAGLAYHF